MDLSIFTGAAQEEDGGFDGMGGGDGNDENLDPNVELGQQRNEKRRQSRVRNIFGNPLKRYTLGHKEYSKSSIL